MSKVPKKIDRVALPGLRIRNSTAEFFIFTSQAGEQSIEARYEVEV